MASPSRIFFWRTNSCPGFISDFFVNNHSDEQEKEEREVFQAFVKKSDLPVIPETIEKCRPPEPDIKCKIRGKGTVGFELTEILDSRFANGAVKQGKVGSILNKFYEEKLLPANKKTFDALYSDAVITLHINASTSENTIKKKLTEIFCCLLTAGRGFEGDKSITFNSNSFKINISRGVTGPCFNCNIALLYRGSPLAFVKNKFKKEYQADYPIYLLAYGKLQQMPPSDHWLDELVDCLNRHRENSPFQKIWIYDFYGHEIKYVFETGVK